MIDRMTNRIKNFCTHIGDCIRCVFTALLALLLGFMPPRLVRDRTGDLATNTIGGIIVAVVIIGLLVVAVNTFFPGFFAEMFSVMSTKLNANW